MKQVDQPPVISRAEASERGLKRFFTGEPCKHGHIAERFVKNYHCTVCEALSNKAWRQAFPERARASAKTHYEASRERAIAYVKKWSEANPDRVRARRKAWYEANREHSIATAKAWREANHERALARDKARYEANPAQAIAYLKAWKKANPERYRATGCVIATRRRLLIDLQTPAWADPQAIATIYRYCPPGMHVDHWAPIKGSSVCGLHCPANLQYLTGPENSVKSNRFPSDDAWTRDELRAMRAATRAKIARAP